jgi:excisionase family DNA binding protein
MKSLRSKMTTEELADSLGVARQTVNRWIRKNGWKTEGINGVKGGRARLVYIDAQVRKHIMNIPAIRKRQALYQLAETNPHYGDSRPTAILRQITDALEKMTIEEQEGLALLLALDGIKVFHTRNKLNKAGA